MDGDLEVLTAVVGHLASTSGVTSEGVLANHARSVGRSADIDGVVAASITAAGSAGVGADEGASLRGSVETAGALGALGRELDALHVDLAGDVEAAVGAGAEGELEDGLVQETHEQVRVVEGSTAAAGEAVSDGELLGLASGELDGDEGLVGVDPHGGLAPAPDHGVLVSGVGEGGRVLAVATDPDLAVLVLGVDAELGSELGGEALDAAEDVADDVANGVRRGRLSRGGRGGGGGRGGCWGAGRLRRGRSDDLGLGSGGRASGRGRSGGGRGSGGRAVVDLAPVHGAEVEGNVGPVDVVGVAGLDFAGEGVSTRQQAAARGAALTVACGSWRGRGWRQRRVQRRGRPAPEQIGNACRWWEVVWVWVCGVRCAVCVRQVVEKAGRRDVWVRLQRVTGVNGQTAA